jgi:hypothetical protein
MSDDLVKRLRDKVEASRIYDDDEELLDEAADRIAKLEAALAKIAQHDMQAIAMDALRPGERIRQTLDAE